MAQRLTTPLTSLPLVLPMTVLDVRVCHLLGSCFSRDSQKFSFDVRFYLIKVFLTIQTFVYISIYQSFNIYFLKFVYEFVFIKQKLFVGILVIKFDEDGGDKNDFFPLPLPVFSRSISRQYDGPNIEMATIYPGSAVP